MMHACLLSVKLFLFLENYQFKDNKQHFDLYLLKMLGICIRMITVVDLCTKLKIFDKKD